MKLKKSEHTVFLTLSIHTAMAPGKEPGEWSDNELKAVDKMLRDPRKVLAELDTFASRVGRYRSWKVATRLAERLAPGGRRYAIECGTEAWRGLNPEAVRTELLEEIEELVRVCLELKLRLPRVKKDIPIREGDRVLASDLEIVTPSSLVYHHLKKRLPREAELGKRRRGEVTLVDGRDRTIVFPGAPDSAGFALPDKEPPFWVRGSIRRMSKEGRPHCKIRPDKVEGQPRKTLTVLMDSALYDQVYADWKPSRIGLYQVQPKIWTLGGFRCKDVYELKAVTA